MSNKKYHLPDFLSGQCSESVYKKWLSRKAVAHVKRDRKRGNKGAKTSIYKEAIHDAVLRSKGKDAYTGKLMDWKNISKYDNDKSNNKGRNYKKQFGDLPTVDHIGDGTGDPEFEICSWRTNDSKNDLTIDEFKKLCRQVLMFSGNFST